ncbi:uncharacterized protein BCR38DRAFT_346145 [Pseudomassariella vexata]|uniref:Cell cycle inhibitor Nif1 n=1 Tax=Pseudomassariella vexata TaxID=1141098 RepID=A0A1Y2DSL7_9PEZI|nr:uncharacterized protein BCR38DRAFT_346145 [Pseudomassariella vexata]ORY62250.1 hypothetical protein BCR38DRAFT_346145 [Pseudomassariella vexata]
MASRPNHIDLRATSSASMATSISRPLRSPRLHVAGDVPPALSPLDAFAAQSRLLAKQLEQSSKTGRRMSRLPPLTTESPLVVQGRSEYFRSLSHDSAEEMGEHGGHGEFNEGNTGLGLTAEVESPSEMERPRSMHPRMSRIPATPDESIPVPPNPFLATNGEQLDQLDDNEGFFGARRDYSPPDLDHLTNGATVRRSIDDDDPNPRESALWEDHISVDHPPSPAGEKLSRQVSHDSGLAPPRSTFPKRSSSIMSAPVEYHDDEATDASFYSQPPRKMSGGSAYSGPALVSPAFPNKNYQRSPSISSVASLPRPSFNFSRPLSRAGTPSLDMPSRQASSDSHPSFVLADDTAHTPVSMHSEAFPDIGIADDGQGAPSYIYSKYSLPRGKALQRGSLLFNPDDVAQFTWEQQMVPPSNVQSFARGGQAPPSPPSRPSSSSSRLLDTAQGADSLLRPSLERSKLSNEVSVTGEPSPGFSRPSTEADSRLSEDVPRGRPLTSPVHDQDRGRTPMSTSTSDSASTIRPARSLAPTAAEMSAEEHLTKGIKCHEEGSVKESTYHLRLAARGGSSTGMLLYALACRHGWGMRPNQKEGVQWLRKAAEGASLEIAEDEGHVKDGKTVDPTERKTRKAQFALSIYELGVSHMNGWGIEQDKSLALRCFEIAGNWGDVDALAEAGFCYAQGVGCKKDLMKSAKFYRMAEAKGMSMPGNSWIHKAKYSDDASSVKSKQGRSKSRARGKSLFGKRAKETQEALP